MTKPSLLLPESTVYELQLKSFLYFLNFSEVALYALDVYYNQTYLNRNDNRNDGGQFPTNQEQQYYDYYQQTFR